MYFNGRGVQQSNSEAMNWYRKAAGQGSANAEFSIGMMYYQGKGVEKNDVEAIRWYQEAAKKGHDEAKKMLIAIQQYHEKIQQNDEQIKRKNMEEERQLISKNKQYKGDLMSANFEDIEIRAFLMILADFTGLNIVVSDRVRGTINLHFQNEPWDKVLDSILENNGLSAKAVGNKLYIGLHSEF
jgi:TPR repeat protein